MFVLVIFGTWHAIIGALIFNLNNFDKITPTSYWFLVDRYFFIVLGSAFVIAHVLFIVWHCRVPFHIHRQMQVKDNEYRTVLAKKMQQNRSSPATTNGPRAHAVNMH